MPSPTPLSPQPDGNVPAALAGTTEYWLSPDDDLALGCECADPALQIERWGQEAAAFLQRGA